MDLHRIIWNEYDLTSVLLEMIREKDWILNERKNLMSVDYQPEYNFESSFSWLSIDVQLNKKDLTYNRCYPLCKKNFYFFSKIYWKLRRVKNRLKDKEHISKRRKIIKELPKNFVRNKNIDKLLE